MTSLPIRDPVADHLVTPENSALILIDYQPTQFSSIRSMDPALLLKNVVSTSTRGRTPSLWRPCGPPAVER
jgi:hypothetical protein